MELMQEIMRQWYLLLSQASAVLSLPLKGITEQVQLPIFAVLLIGLVGALSPCQLTTNLSAIAYVSRRPGEGRVWAEALAYTAGKIVIYSLFGGAVIVLGLTLEQSAIPIVVFARKIVGPLMIVIGFGLMGMIRLRGSAGAGLYRKFRGQVPERGVAGAFLLGAVFSFLFCPTLFWLFFGLMLPMALTSTGGWVFPGLFALGTALPFLMVAGLLSAGTDPSRRLMEQSKLYHGKITKVSGAILILAGVNDTLTYWFI